jgi:hypothetical protein
MSVSDCPRSPLPSRGWLQGFAPSPLEGEGWGEGESPELRSVLILKFVCFYFVDFIGKTVPYNHQNLRIWTLDEQGALELQQAPLDRDAAGITG